MSASRYFVIRGGRLLYKTADILRTHLLKAEIMCDVHSRLKDPYSVLKKLARKNLTIAQLTDLIAFRIIVNNEEDCYKAFDVVHDLYSVQSKFKDFIISPKPNGYQSLHTVVLLSYLKRSVEMQIRTYQMHRIAELGRAAHLEYKHEQDQRLKEFFNLQESALKRAYVMQTNFTWTESEVSAYERELTKIWNKRDKTKEKKQYQSCTAQWHAL